jgi:hypothetical protein
VKYCNIFVFYGSVYFIFFDLYYILFSVWILEPWYSFVRCSWSIISSLVLYRCETLSVTSRGEHRLRVFENRVLRRIFGPKRVEVTGCGEDYVTRSFMLCTPHQISFGWWQIKTNEMGRLCGTCGVEERCIQGFGGETWGKETALKT